MDQPKRPEKPANEDGPIAEVEAVDVPLEGGTSEPELPAEQKPETEAEKAEEPSPAEEPPPMGADPTDEEKFYLDWGRETLKGNITRINDLQKSLVTLSVSFLGGSIVFYSDAATTPIFKVLVTAVLLAGAIVAFLGSVPVQYKLDLDDPGQIRQVKARTLETKKRWYIASAIFLVAGLGLAALGLAAKSLGP